MARFKPASEIQNTEVNRQVEQQSSVKNYPFKNLYGCAEGDMIYINMEAVQGLQGGMRTLRDIGLIVDISGSMNKYYKDGSVERMCKQLVDSVAAYDDDGIDILFFAKGLVYNTTVKNADEVSAAIQTALQSRGAYGSTMPAEAFRTFTDQIKQKGRAGTVLFLTDGAMDDGGRELKSYYQNILHEEFKTRDNFYCYAIEFGHSANGALDVLDGMYKPDQGPEDLFDLDGADDLDKIASVLAQVGGMSAVGSDVELKASVDSGVKIDMVNADLIDGGMDVIQGAINKVMSFRVISDHAFTLKVEIAGYDTMNIKVTPNGVDVDLQIV